MIVESIEHDEQNTHTRREPKDALGGKGIRFKLPIFESSHGILFILVITI
jgi:hypothetical protein